MSDFPVVLWDQWRRCLSEWLRALFMYFPLKNLFQIKARREVGSSSGNLSDLIKAIQDHKAEHFRLYLDCDDLAALAVEEEEEDSFMNQWKKVWQENKRITRVTITISEPFATATTSTAGTGIKSILNQLLLGVGHLPNLREICLSDIFDDDDVYIFPISIVTQWLQQAQRLERLQFYMAHLSLTAATSTGTSTRTTDSVTHQESSDLVEPLAQALQNHPTLSELELDHCTFHTHNPLVSSEDKLYHAFVHCAQHNWNMRRIAIKSSCFRRHCLQDSIDYHCKLNGQRQGWYDALYRYNRNYSSGSETSETSETATTKGSGKRQHESLLDKLPTNDLDSLYYYLLEVNPTLLAAD